MALKLSEFYISLRKRSNALQRSFDDRQYTDIHMTDKCVHLSSKTLLYFDNILCNSGFVRVHRSYLVNLSHVKLFRRPSEEIQLSNGHGIKLAYNMREEFLDLMTNYIKKSP